MQLAVIAVACMSVDNAQAQGNADKGKKVYRKCAVCHAIGPGAKNKVGPSLNGILGRKAGTVEGFKYSEANKEAGANGWVWTEEVLLKYLENPRKAMPGNRMAFAGLKLEQDRLDLVAYIKTFKESKANGSSKPEQKGAVKAPTKAAAKAPSTQPAKPSADPAVQKAEPAKPKVESASSALAGMWVGGSSPSIRPAEAPHVSGVRKSPGWYATALTGLSKPYPASFRFLEDQGRWYTPFNEPGMTGPYDLRGWHRR